MNSSAPAINIQNLAYSYGKAEAVDPLSPNKQNSLGATLYRAGRYDEALEQFREVPDPDANSEFRHRRMAAIYERKGMWKESKTSW